MKVNVDPCACVWGGIAFPANTPVWSSREVPFVGDRLGKNRSASPRAALPGPAGTGRSSALVLGETRGGKGYYPRLLLRTEGRRGWFCLLS